MKLNELSQLVASLTNQDGAAPAGFDGVQLFRVSQPVDRIPGVYPPSLCLIVQGEKRATFGGAKHRYNQDKFLCSSMSIPVEAEVPAASEEKPLLGLLISLETKTFAETIVEFEASAASHAPGAIGSTQPGLGVFPWNDGMVSALVRMLTLMKDPQAMAVLGAGRLREFFFEVLRSDAGPMVRSAFRGSNDLLPALEHITKNLGEPLTIEDLAERVGMSRTVFHRRFKEATTLPPLQYIKAVRLSAASQLLAQGNPVGQVATEVGYVSAAQFGREFRRQFGKTPREWRAFSGEALVEDVQAT